MGNVALPSYGNQLDVYHEDKLDDILVLETSGSPTTAVTLIVWDDVADTDQRALLKIFGQYSFPGTPTEGRHTVKIDTQQFVGSPNPTGLKSARNYSVTVSVTGPGSPNTSILTTATISGQPTFPRLAASLSAEFLDVNVAVTNTGGLQFSTVATGANSKVEIQPHGTLFNPASSLLGFNGFGRTRVGVTTTRDVLELNRTSANVLFSDRYSFIIRKRRPYLNQPQILPLRGFRTEYFDTGSNSFGSPSVGVWRLLGTNALSGSPATTPSWLLP